MTIAPVNNILRSISKARSDSDIKLNILTACRNNEKYIALLSQTKHNFYILKEHKWNHLIETCPSNVQTLNEHYYIDEKEMTLDIFYYFHSMLVGNNSS